MTISKRSVTVVLFLFILLSMWSPGEELPAMLTPLRYAVFLALSGFIIFTAYVAKGLRVPKSAEAVLIAAFLFYVSLSALWSVQQADTYIKALLILSAMLTCLGISSLMRLNETLRILFAAAATFVVASVIVAVLVPSIGVETGWEHAGKWKGLSAQKNGLGGLSALALVAGLALPLKPRATPARQTLALAGRVMVVAMAALAVFMAGSRGAQLTSLLGITSLLVAYAPRLLQRLALVALLLFSVPLVNLGVSTFVLDADKIGIVGLTIDTNSRTTIWEYGLEQMAGRELLGYGVSGFWTQERMIAFQDIHGWVLDNFHNGYITILIEGGLVGFLLFTLGLALCYVLLLVAIGTMKDRFLALAFALLNNFAIGNLVENEAGRSTSSSIIIFAVIAFSLRSYISQRLAENGAKRFVDHRRTIPPRLTGPKPRGV